MYGVGFLTLVSFVVCGVTQIFATHKSAEAKIDPVVPTICVYLMKLLIANVLYRSMDGTYKELVGFVAANKIVLLKYCLPAACLAFFDLMSYVSLSRMPPAQYLVLIQLRVVLVAFCWQFVMQKWLTASQWFCLIACIWAVLLTERDTIISMVRGEGTISSMTPYALIALQIALSMTGNLASEKFLKSVNLTVNAQNVMLYGLATVILCVELVGMSIVKGRPVFSLSEIPKLGHPAVILSIMALSFLGITVSFMLKYLGNVVKEIANMFNSMLVATLDWWVFAISSWGILDVQAVVLMAIGIVTYSLTQVRITEENKLKDRLTKAEGAP